MPEIPILEQIYERIPIIDRKLIPDAETAALIHIGQLLAELNLYERQFFYAAELFQYSQAAGFELRRDFALMDRSLWTTGAWQQMAARDASMTVYHFGKALEGLQSSFGNCPSLRAMVDHKKIRQAADDFKSAFPNNEKIRNAVAHVADNSGTIQKKASHAIKGRFKSRWFLSDDPDAETWLPGNMNGKTFAITYKGNIFTFDLSVENANVIRSIKLNVFSAFERTP